MPRLFLFRGFAIFFWTGEDGEPVHVHVAKGRPSPSATKIWLTCNGGCLLADVPPPCHHHTAWGSVLPPWASRTLYEDNCQYPCYSSS